MILIFATKTLSVKFSMKFIGKGNSENLFNKKIECKTSLFETCKNYVIWGGGLGDYHSPV